MINGHGDDLYAYEGGITYNFSSNVYYKGCPPLLLNLLQENSSIIQNYPSPAASELNGLAAKKHGLAENQFLFTNGATEAFYLIAHYFKWKKASIVAPTFSEYEDACKIHQIDYKCIPVDAIYEKASTSNLLFICNPNNPTGTVFSIEEIENLLQLFPNTFFIIDEAYMEFTNATTSSVALIKNNKNIAIVKSLTKTFVIPGLRLGYVVSNSDFIDDLLSLKMPWSVNAMAIAAGEIIFNNYEALSFNADELFAEKKVFCKSLSKITWLEVMSSNTSYFLVRLKKGKAADLKEYLAKEHQILIRDATNFKGLEGEFIRLSTQSIAVNTILIEALQKWN